MRLILVVLVLVACAFSAGAGEVPSTQPAPDVAVGILTYANGKRDDCYSSAFLGEVGRESTVRVNRELQPVALADLEKLRAFPMLVMSGSGVFTLPEAESKNLRAFLTRGGFLLASAHCENPQWVTSFRAAIAASLPEGKWVRLDIKHKIFHTLYDIDALRTRQATDQNLLPDALMFEGRVVCLFSSLGLNDSDSLPASCCCCGANELRDARKINANVLMYALLH